MTNRLELNWKLDGFVDEQRYYCSETPIDPENLPMPKAVLAGDARTYVDTSADVDKIYYVLLGSVKNSTEKLSSIVRVSTSRLTPTIKSLFNGEDRGGAYNFQDLSTLWQDIAGTIPVTTVGQFIARVDDISGNNNHIIQSVESKRPQLQRDARGYYLWFDGLRLMQSNTAANLSGLSQFTIFASLSRERTAYDEVIFESSPNYNDNSGALNFSFTTSGIAAATRGTGSYPSGYALASIQSDVDATYIVAFNLLATSKVQFFRRNGSDAPITSRLDTTSQTLTNQILFVGGRGAGTYPSVTKLRSLVLLGRTASTLEIEIIEQLLNT
ncbi:hypothetical protein [Acinetobacter brisouii]|uniref:hypothetical protein n=1 Tax=Acinetobacter brisouii TaxID=396323 RepID=UPI0005F7C3AA|nr:hypothetical protein [Acinetobacter brisouii]KJV37898.1 hypothetical protein VH98_11020 [Acinetobacter brisouii]